MSILDLTQGTERRPGTTALATSTSDDTLAELTRTISAAFTARGIARHARGELDHALADLDQALRLDPGNPEALVMRAYVHLAKGDQGLAYGDVDEALRLNPEHAEAVRVRGLTYQAAGNSRRAEAEFAQSGSMFPTPPGGRGRWHLSAGYHVVARFEPYSSAREVLLVTYPLDGLSEAQADADRYSYAPEDRRRLVDQGVVNDPDFDAVVYEVRSVAREVVAYGALDDRGNSLTVGDTSVAS